MDRNVAPSLRREFLCSRDLHGCSPAYSGILLVLVLQHYHFPYRLADSSRGFSRWKLISRQASDLGMSKQQRIVPVGRTTLGQTGLLRTTILRSANSAETSSVTANSNQFEAAKRRSSNPVKVFSGLLGFNLWKPSPRLTGRQNIPKIIPTAMTKVAHTNTQIKSTGTTASHN
jgi:hypothetical protein